MGGYCIRPQEDVKPAVRKQPAGENDEISPKIRIAPVCVRPRTGRRGREPFLARLELWKIAWRGRLPECSSR